MSTSDLFRVALDPGHGERGEGARCEGLVESELNEAMAQRVDHLCVVGGIASRVIRGKRGDGWTKLDAMAKHHRAELVVSMHHNASAHGQRGAMAFFHPSNRQGQIIAETITRSIAVVCPGLSSKWTAAYPCDHPSYPRSRTVVEAFGATSVLVEYAFLTSEHDRHELGRPYTHNLLAAATYGGIVRGAQLFRRSV